MISDSWRQIIDQRLAQRRESSTLRALATSDIAANAAITINGHRCVNFSSNDYLGLASNPAQIDMPMAPRGATASQLIGGRSSEIAELEATIAHWKQSQSALVFGSGWQCNTGVVPTICDADTTIFSDELNHASLIDGIRASRAQRAIFRHNDMQHLQQLLNDCATPRKIIITEGIFSMDGDAADLVSIVELSQKHSAMTYVDEAHSAGVLGPNAAGLAADLGLQDQIDIQMGTLGKAIGSFGAYVACEESLRELLFNETRSFVFSTALPPYIAQQSTANIHYAQNHFARAHQALTVAREFAEQLRSQGWQVLDTDSLIVPVMIGDASRTMKLSTQLRDAGFFIQGIRQPTVPAGQSRLRITITTAHTPETIEDLVRTFEKLRESA